MGKKILLVDDNEDLRYEIREFLDTYDIIEASTGEGALSVLRRANDIGLVILDVMMPGINGLDALVEIKRMTPAPSVIILTGHSSKDVAIEALKSRADDYIEKPIDVERFREAVDKFMAIQAGEPEVSSMDIVGKMEKVQRFIEQNCFKKISLSDAANAVSLSPKYLSRVFKEKRGDGFNEYKLKVKIGKAKDILKTTGCTVDQISTKLGYENAESFIRQFKNLTGSTPTSYRLEIRNQKARKARKKSVRPTKSRRSV